MTASPEPDFDRTAWSWVSHLRGGGTTPWTEWSGHVDEAGADDPLHAIRLPGAAQLEVVRRLAARRGDRPIDFTRLADRVLGRSGPGRGLGEIPLAHKGSAPNDLQVGMPAGDPSRVPVPELIRVCVGVLSDLVTATATQPPDDQSADRRPSRSSLPSLPAARQWPWSRRYTLEGPPQAVGAVRASLAGSGLVEGGRRPTVVIVTDTLESMLCQVWVARTERGSDMRWAKFARSLARADRLPPSVDLAAVAARWSTRVGADRVHVVAPIDDAAQARRTVADILGITTPLPNPAGQGAIPPAGADVLRRLNSVLNVRVQPDVRRRALREAASHLQGPGRPLLVPAECAEWAQARARRMTEDLLAGGYAVHGDVGRVASRLSNSSTGVRGAEVLDLALDACLSAAEQEQRSQEVGRQ